MWGGTVEDWLGCIADDCLLLLVVDISNGVATSTDDEVAETPDCCKICGLDVTATCGTAKDVAAVADGIVNDIPRSAAIGCHGLRADRFNSLPVILAFRRDL